MNARSPLLAIVGFLLLAPAVSVGAQDLDTSPIAKALNELVLGKKVTTKLPVIADLVERRSFSNSVHYAYVDAGFYEDGTVVYHVLDSGKGGTSYFVKPYVIKDNTKVLQPGTEIQLAWKISYFPDRIEIRWFDNGPAGSISLLLANGYEAWPVERILNFLYKIISIPAIDERPEDENQYKTMAAELKSHVDSAQAASPSVPLDMQIENKTVLYKAYRDLADVVAKLRSIHDPIISSDSTDYGALAEGVENQLVDLRKAAELDRQQKALEARARAIHDMQEKGAGDEASLQKMFLQLDRSEPRLEADLTKRSQALQSAQEIANDWLRCVNVLSLANQDTAAERARQESANQHILRLRASLDASRARFQSRSLDTKYESMASKLAQLKSAYAASFGTPGADTAKADLRNQFSQMIANRESAAAGGSSVAKQQAEQLRAELGRLH
jgi:hypothetical protein